MDDSGRVGMQALSSAEGLVDLECSGGPQALGCLQTSGIRPDKTRGASQRPAALAGNQPATSPTLA